MYFLPSLVVFDFLHKPQQIPEEKNIMKAECILRA